MAEKRRIGKFSDSAMRRAVLRVVDGGSIRGIAKESKIPYATLRYYVSKYHATDEESRNSMRFSPNYEVNLIFSEELESELEQYLIVARRLHYSLSSDHVRQLTYDLAVKHNLKIPLSWKLSRRAGKHWMYCFLKRHPIIKNIMTLSKKNRTFVGNLNNSKRKVIKRCRDELIVPDVNLERRDELIVPDVNLEEFILSDVEEVDVTSKPVVIISIKKDK